MSIGGFSYRTLWNLTWPQFMMMLFQMLIGFVDVYVAGRIGASVQATIGLLMQCLFFFLVFATTLASAVLATVGQSVGAGKKLRAQRYAGLAIGLGLLCCLALVGLVTIFRTSLIDLIQTPQGIRPIAFYFLDVILYTLPAHYLLVVSSAIFRAHGKVTVPLLSIMLACVVNTVADFGFGLGYFGLPNWGYKGLAWATFFSVSAAALFNLLMLIRESFLSRYSVPPWRWIKAGTPYLIKVGVPAGLSQVFWNLGYLVLYVLTATLPFDSIDATAGLTTGLRIESILFLPGAAFSMTASIVVSNLLGAGKRLEARQAAQRVLVFGIVAMSAVAVPLWFAAPAISGQIAADAAVQQHTLVYLRFNLCSTPFTMCSVILSGVMVGAGATAYNLLAHCCSTWFVRLPLAYLLGHVIWQSSSGVYFSMLLSQLFMSSLLFYLFKYRNWARFAMIKR